MNNIKWVKPRRGKKHNCDVFIATRMVQRKNGKKVRTAFIQFFDGAEEQIAPRGKMIIGVYGQRLYFAETEERGYKATKDAERSKRIQTSDAFIVSFCEKYRGGYWLKTDAIKKLKCIDVNEKVED